LELAPGERLKEAEWAGRLSVSRSAIRESLTRLRGEGLVEQGRKGGFFVREMTESDIHQIKELRQILETAALLLACERATPKQLAHLEELCDDFANFARKGYVTGAFEADMRFHNMLMDASGNPRLHEFYMRSNIIIFNIRQGRARGYIDDHELTENDHRAIVEAIRRKDHRTGIKILKEHFDRGERNVLESNSANSRRNEDRVAAINHG
jgi:DNA-binding GntR family transcriptional regulator